jgi:hypothetical protein
MFIGVANGISQIRLVAEIRPDADYSVISRVLLSYATRLGLVTGGLILAVMNGFAAAVGMFCSLWLVRWGFVFVGWRGLIDWAELDVNSQGAD